MTNSGSITHVPYENAYGAGYEDMQRRVPDCTRARKQIGFRPTRSLASIIEAVVVDQVGNGLLATAAS